MFKVRYNTRTIKGAIGNIASSEAYFSKNFYSLFLILSCCLHQPIVTLTQKDAIILPNIYHTMRTLQIIFLFKFSMQECCFDFNYFSCKFKMDCYEQQYKKHNVTHDQQVIFGEINSLNSTIAMCYQSSTIHSIALYYTSDLGAQDFRHLPLYLLLCCICKLFCLACHHFLCDLTFG